MVALSRYNAPMRQVTGTDGPDDDAPNLGLILEDAALAIARLQIDPACPDSLSTEEQIEWIYKHEKTIEWNEAFALQYGYEKDADMSQVPLRETFPLDDDRNRRFAHRFIVNGYRASREETFEQDRFGKAKAFLVTCNGTVANKQLSEIWVSMIDITALKVAQRDLRYSEDKFAKAFHSSPDAILITRVEDGEIVDVNDGFTEMTGFAREEALGESTIRMQLWRRPEERSSLIEMLRRDGQARNIEAEFTTKSGEVITCLTSGEFIELGGSTFILSTTRDITDEKRAQRERELLSAQLYEAQKLKAVGQLTSGIAHDFNNILSSVIGYAELATETVQASEAQPLQKYLGEIRRASYRARDLVAQLLNFSRRERSESEVINVATHVDSVISLLRPTMPSTIDFQAASIAANVRIDSVQLEQILVNLCINARDAMKGNGKIRIAVTRERAASRRCDACGEQFDVDHVSITVCDSGPGLTVGDKSRVFEPFFTTKAIGEGSGMGLAMVDKITHSHHGHVTIDGSSWGGLSVQIYLPESAQQARSAPVQVVTRGLAANEEQRANVLVVDDERSVGTLIGQLLESRGFNATIVDDSQVALDHFRSHGDDIDIVVTDQTMPKLTGVELSAELLSIQPELPIVLCSGYTTEIDANRARKLGIRGYHDKPIEIEAFISQLRRLLDAA